MPQILILALAGAGLYAGYKVVTRTAAAVRAEVDRARAENSGRASAPVEPVDLGALEWDPASGVYKPRRKLG